MYGRRYAGRDLRFQPSGGLLHAALVMRDRETGSYWPIMTGRAEAGKLKGTRLHVENNPYDQYFASDSGFRETSARDPRLATKEPIWAFELGGRRFAVPFRAFEGGRAFQVADRWIFLYRPKGASLYASTRAWVSEGSFTHVDGAWIHQPSGGRFEPGRDAFVGAPASDPRPLPGFDTFWYVWSLTHPDTEVVDARP